MKRKMLVWMLLTIAVGASSQNQTIRDVFRQMPDSLMPYLSQNDRLDFIDFIDSNMRAQVKNKFGGTSEMTALTDDSLSIKMNDVLRVDMMLEQLPQPVDSVSEVVVFIETIVTDSLYGESRSQFFTKDWHPFSVTAPLSETLLKRWKNTDLQNILKRDEDYLNKH